MAFLHSDQELSLASMPQKLQLHRPFPNVPFAIVFPLLESESEEQKVVVDLQKMRSDTYGPLRRFHLGVIELNGL